MKHEGHIYIVAAGDLAHARRKRFESVAPAFAAVAGDQQAPLIRLFHAGSKQWQAFEQCIDAGVSGHFDLPLDAFSTEVSSAQLGRREEQGSNAVDADSKVLFRPRVQTVVAAKPRFDMGDGKAGLGSAERATERARRVPLHDDQPSLPDRGGDASGDVANMKLRVGPSRAAELDRRDQRHAVVHRLKVGMLSGEDEARADAAMEERFG
jgi:hypothetical protein